MNSFPQWVAVGRIARAHGIKGEVAVLPLSSVERRFGPGSVLFAGPEDRRPLTVAAARPHQHRILVSFREVHDRDQAEELRGQYLFVPADSAPPLPAGEYWVHQVIGCDVITETGRRLGQVRDVLRNPANDLWVAGEGDGEVLIPALRDVVLSVDPAGRRIVVRDVAGLTAP